MKEFEERSTRVYRQKQMFSKQELEERENVCIRDEPAFCAAACPLKLDARAFVKSMKEGDFTGARAQLERIAPFPFILSRGCEAPCEGACRLAELGEGVHIGALERACMTLGAAKSGRGMLKIKKKKTVAIFGADLFSLALAGELANKAYPVTFFCEEENAAAIIRKAAPFLTEPEAAAEAARLEQMDIALVKHAQLTPALFEEQRGRFDILCASRAFSKTLDSEHEPDEVTLLTDLRVIAPLSNTEGVLFTLFDAKRAAVSVDRLAQNMDPATSRGMEGVVTSRLYTNMEEVEPSSRIPEGEGYGAEEAKKEASRCIECSCEECAKGCAYLRHYKKYPRQLTREIYNNVSIIMGDHMMNKPINSCALCGQCSVTCPLGYDLADVCHIARENMVATGKMPLAPHEFALQDMLFSNEEAFLSRPQSGFETCAYVFFPGCQAGAVAPETVKRAYEDLCRRLNGGVALILGCCGAIAYWAGRYELFGETCDALRAEIAKFGEPKIIAGCPTCQKTLGDSLEKEILGVWDVLNEIGLPETAKKEHQSVAIHDSCGARGNEKTQKAVRTLAQNLGLELIETEYSGDQSPCCGYGGLVSYANREVAHELAQSCVSRSNAPFVTYCMACRDRFAREGHASTHILELVYGSSAENPPDISEKRRNRLRLKNSLLKELWGEDEMEKDWGFALTITEEARLQMDDRMILDSDVYAVMQAYRESGDAVLDSETNLLITRHRIGNVTFWVKFEEKEDGYIVRGAYSHRMIVK
ncbi:MAG: pyridine nucleotide-disulfide oxidoreductase/dicluster-binding protein [Christensenellales bacterium]|jgi:Fe-S oxidoreductase